MGKMIAACFLSVFLAACSGAGATQKTPSNDSGGLLYSLNVSSTYSGGYYGIYDQLRGTQTLDFDFKGSTFFGDSGFKNQQHLFVVMQGKLGDPGDALQGIGLAIGNTSERPSGDGCNGIAVESFEGGENQMYPSTCNQIGFVDGDAYRVKLTATLDGTVSYAIYSGDGSELASSSVSGVPNVNQSQQRSVMLGLTTPASDATGGMGIVINSYSNH